MSELPLSGAHWVDHVRRHAFADPGGVALRCDGESTTWGALETGMHRCARLLAASGVAPGDRVALLMGNRAEWVEVLLGISACGAVAVPVNFRLRASEIAHIVADSGASIMVTDGTTAAEAAAVDVPILTIGGGYEALRDAQSSTPLPVAISELDLAMIMYTSGTTGRPKGAMLTHLNMLVATLTSIRNSRAFGDAIVTMVNVPLFHIAGVTRLLPGLTLGRPSVIMPSRPFDPAETLAVVRREGVTELFLVPAQWQQLCALPGVGDHGCALRTLMWGAAPASERLLRRMAEVFPDAQIVSSFGQTETSPVATVLTGSDSVRKIGSVGRPIPTVVMRVVDEDGNDVQPGDVGEIVYRGPTVMSGYWNDPEATAAAFAGGWFHSGDLVRQDDEGFIYVVDRKKDMIISGGENIYCAEVEAALGRHPQVREVAVVGAPHERWGETPVAVVVPEDAAAPPTLDELVAFVADQLASYKKPTRLVIRDELPRNASGKVRKDALRQAGAGWIAGQSE